MCENCRSKTDSGKTWKEVNKEHFDNNAQDMYKLDWVRDMLQQVAAWLQTNRAWIGIPEDCLFESGTGVRILDYACGNGVLSRALAPYAAHVRGMDISSTMVQLYNEAAAEADFSPERMRAVEGDILSAALTTPEFDGFDLAFISLALHHVEDPVAVVRGMAARVRPGGKVVVVDWKAMDLDVADVDHDEAYMTSALNTVAHHGFSWEQMHDIFGKAGLVGSEMRLHPVEFEATSVGAPLQVFYAVAEKPVQ